MDGETTSVDYALKVDIQDRSCWFLRVAIRIGGKVQVVCAGPDARIRKNVIDPAMLLLSLLEEGNEIGPFGDICLHKQRALLFLGRRLNIATDDRGSQGEQ